MTPASEWYAKAPRVSPHLTWAELACKDGQPYPLEWRADRAVRLAAVFEAIRTACGDQPIRVLSAFRSPEYNAKIGGAHNSQHVQGRALDLRPPDGYTVRTFYAAISNLAKHEIGEIRGIGLYLRAGFVHVDIRPSAQLVTWNGGAATKDAPAA